MIIIPKMFVFLQHRKYNDMTRATIQSVRQTEKAGLFTICFEGDSYTEFQKFIIKGNENERFNLTSRKS